MTDRREDPFGKRALYWLPVEREQVAAADGGKRALFTGDAPGGPGPDPDAPVPVGGAFLVRCSRCGAESRAGLLDLLVLRLPVGWWLPWRSYDHFIRCPSCGRRSWVQITLGAPT